MNAHSERIYHHCRYRGFWNSGTLPGFCNMTKPQVKNNVSLPCLLTTLNLHSSAYQTQCLLPRVPSFPLHCTMLSFVHFCPVYHHTPFGHLLNNEVCFGSGSYATAFMHWQLSYGLREFKQYIQVVSSELLPTACMYLDFLPSQLAMREVE